MLRAYSCLALLGLSLSAASLRAGDVEELRDIAYGKDAMQRLDIYLPRGVRGKLPAVLWIHGGGWSGGDKSKEPNGILKLVQPLIDKGFVAISCNYRLAPKHRHPAQVEDVQRVVRWLRAHADQYHIDPERIGAAGISAGGHLACMLAVRETRTKQSDELDKFSSRVRAAVSLNGASDLREKNPKLQTAILTRALAPLVGDDPKRAAERQADASPLLFVDKHASPTLFVVGTKDVFVANAQSQVMADALKKHGVATEIISLEGAGHGIFPSTTPKARDAILRWFGKYLKQ